MDRDDTLTPAMDNVLAYHLSKAFNETANESAGDFIDRGLALRAALEQHGFGLVKLSDDSLFIGQHPRT